MIKLAAIISTCIIGTTLAFFYYTGMFDHMEITRESRGPYCLVYREYRGPHKGTRYMMNTVYRYVRDSLQLSTGTGFTVFYDNRRQKPDRLIRSISGVVVADSITVPSSCKSWLFKRCDAVVGRFRLRSFFSYAIGSYRFYSQLAGVVEKKHLEYAGPVLELYDMPAKTIWYIAPVGRGTELFPEFGGE